MTSVIFNDWLVKWDRELKRKIVLLADNCTAHTNCLVGRQLHGTHKLSCWQTTARHTQIVLLADNCTAHTNHSLLKNIKVIFLPANTTSLIQSCDQSIIRAFKAHYRREMRARFIAELDDIQDRSDASAVAKKFPFLVYCIW